MKTIEDVVKAYPDGWPDESTTTCYTDFTNLLFMRHENRNFGVLKFVCTREEYEQALEENKVNTEHDWYKNKELPPINTLLAGGKTYTENGIKEWFDFPRYRVVGHHVNGEVFFVEYLNEKGIPAASMSTFRVGSYQYKPFTQQKIASLDWLVKSGIDCEFSDGGHRWAIEKLTSLCKSDDGFRYVGHKYGWKKCRPRLNQPLVLSKEQYQLIPDCFDYEMYHKPLIIEGYESGFYIVTFKGLKDGYIYEWDR